jgi:hypothetical protein
MTHPIVCPHSGIELSDGDIWQFEVDAFVRQFAERAANGNEQPGDIEAVNPAPWTDPDRPVERLDWAYRSGIVPPDQRRVKR